MNSRRISGLSYGGDSIWSRQNADPYRHIRPGYDDNSRLTESGYSVNDLFRLAEEAERRGSAREAREWLDAAIDQQKRNKAALRAAIQEEAERLRQFARRYGR